jgi:pyruvate/oxaloacetate carboxyltransferase
MKRRLLTGSIILAIISVGLGLASTTRAADDIITDEQITVIRNTCSDIQATLNRIHENDKVLRVNKGYLYKAAILDKLMTPLNQRVAANQINGGKLSEIAASYRQQFQQFDQAYQTYERSLAAVTVIDCTKQPTSFYSALLEAYEYRVALQKIDAGLIQLTKDFKQEFDRLFKAEKTKVKANE